MPDPQVFSRIVVPVPTVTLSNGLLNSVTWNYRDASGNVVPGTPGFLATNRLDVLDQNGSLLDSEVFSAATTYNYSGATSLSWANIGALRMAYYDTLTNQYFLTFSESSPTLSGTPVVSGSHTLQFLLNGPPAQNYTIQYSTALNSSVWNTLFVTNGAASPLTVSDPNATNAVRFYRVLVGP
jgi:hypothetical protein